MDGLRHSKTEYSEHHEAGQKIVAIGASAGGLAAIGSLLAGLEPDFPAPILVVMHLLPEGSTVLPGILNKRTRLDVVAAEEGATLEPGKVYVATADRHLCIHKGRIHLDAGPEKIRWRPSVDILFESVARYAREDAIAIVLTGRLDDGTEGCLSIFDRHGTSIVQDPSEAEFPSMPLSVLTRDHPSYVSKLDDMPAVLRQLTSAGQPAA